jgi:hypothetical protein
MMLGDQLNFASADLIGGVHILLITAVVGVLHGESFAQDTSVVVESPTTTTFPLASETSAYSTSNQHQIYELNSALQQQQHSSTSAEPGTQFIGEASLAPPSQQQTQITDVNSSFSPCCIFPSI